MEILLKEKYLIHIMTKLPDEMLNKIFLYLSSPTADIMKPHIKAYKHYSKCVFSNFDTMSFVEFMSVNAVYLDYTSKRHMRDKKHILKVFLSPTYN